MNLNLISNNSYQQLIKKSNTLSFKGEVTEEKIQPQLENDTVELSEKDLDKKDSKGYTTRQKLLAGAMAVLVTLGGVKLSLNNNEETKAEKTQEIAQLVSNQESNKKDEQSLYCESNGMFKNNGTEEDYNQTAQNPAHGMPIQEFLGKFCMPDTTKDEQTQFCNLNGLDKNAGSEQEYDKVSKDPGHGIPVDKFLNKFCKIK